MWNCFGMGYTKSKHLPIYTAEKDNIIWLKMEIKKMFEKDPDLLMYLGWNEKLHHQEGEKEEAKDRINDFNIRLKQPEIVPWLNINPTITDV